MKKIILSIFAICCLTSCTENFISRKFGTDLNIDVEPGKKVIMATWKDDNLFYMVEDMEDDYIPHSKELIESSSWGIIESKVVFKESR